MSEQKCEYSKYDYIIERMKFDPNKIKLLTKIYDRKSTKTSLSVVFTTINDKCYGFGNNQSGCLGIDKSSCFQCKRPTEIHEFRNKKLIKLCSGQLFVLALCNDGRCYSWGDNHFGQLGLSRTNSSINKPMLIDSIKEPIIDLACGLHHSLLLTITNNLYSFGSNLTGAVGNGTKFHQIKPIQLTDYTQSIPFSGIDFVDISCGGWHSAAVNYKGEIFVWGWNQNGQCGNDDLKTNILSPTKLTSINNLIKTVRCGQNHTLMLTYDGKVFAMGSNQYGQCGIMFKDDERYSLNYTQPILVPLDDVIDEIGAWSKSDISIAKSINNDKFYIWGSMINNTKNNDRKSSSNVNEIQKFSTSLATSISMNHILSIYDQTKINDDHKLLPTNYHEDFPMKRILIKINDDIRFDNILNSKLYESFNSPSDSDIVLCFSSSNQDNDKQLLFIQQIIIEKFENFFQNFPKEWFLSSYSDEIINNNNNFNEKDHENELQSLISNNFNNENIIDGISMVKYTQIINKQRKRFNMILLDKNLINYYSMYSFVSYKYCSQKFIITSENNLIKLLCLCESFNDELLVDSCLNYMIFNNDYDNIITKLCSLYDQSLKLESKLIEQFCVNTITKIIDKTSEKSLIFESVFKKRQEKFDLKILLVNIKNDRGKPIEIKCHRLILFLFGNIYQSLMMINERNVFKKFYEKIFQLSFKHNDNIYSTENDEDLRIKLLKLDEIRIPYNSKNLSFINDDTINLFIYYIYNGKFPVNQMISIKQLVELNYFVQIFENLNIKNEIIKHLRCFITIENVCNFYQQYCFMKYDENDNNNHCEDLIDDQNLFKIMIELRQLCMEIIAENDNIIMKLFCCKDFEHFILNNSSCLQQFMFDLNEYFKKRIIN